jgi:organic radical activating enzyme
MGKARISEIFSSIQGEGLYVGEEQAFVRFFGCNLSCMFCDESNKTKFSEYSAGEVVDKILNEGKEVVSLTGGEPLMQVGFLKELLPVLREKEFKIYLETNGTLKQALSEILDYIDIISMDIKLPSATGLRPYWEEHAEFLNEAKSKETFVKSIITPETLLSDIEMAVSIIKSIDKNIPFIIQPVSYNDRVAKIDSMKDFFDTAKERLEDVRIIPQVHKILGVR